MELLREHFDIDYDTVAYAVRLRHDMIQNLKVPPNDLLSSTQALTEVLHRKVWQPVGTT
jgi:predicted thioesterase